MESPEIIPQNILRESPSEPHILGLDGLTHGMLCGCLIARQQAGSKVFGDRLESIQSLIGDTIHPAFGHRLQNGPDQLAEFRLLHHWIFRLLKQLDLELDMVLVELRARPAALPKFPPADLAAFEQAALQAKVRLRALSEHMQLAFCVVLPKSARSSMRTMAWQDKDGDVPAL